MLQWEHSAILLTFIKLQFSIRNLGPYIFEWLIKTVFNIYLSSQVSISTCKYDGFLSLRIVLTLTNSVDPGEMVEPRPDISIKVAAFTVIEKSNNF